jgi:hypothetical protein
MGFSNATAAGRVSSPGARANSKANQRASGPKDIHCSVSKDALRLSNHRVQQSVTNAYRAADAHENSKVDFGVSAVMSGIGIPVALLTLISYPRPVARKNLEFAIENARSVEQLNSVAMYATHLGFHRLADRAMKKARDLEQKCGF